MYNAPTVYHEIQKEHRKHSVVKKSGSHYEQEFYAQTIYFLHRRLQCIQVITEPYKNLLKRKSFQTPFLHSATPQNK